MANARGRNGWSDWAVVPLRLMIGFGFAAHGFAKLGRGPEAFAAMLAGLGVPDPVFAAWATILVELIGGLAVMVGACVTPLSLPLGVVMLVAMFTVHWPYGFSTIKLKAVTPTGPEFGMPGYEMNLLYLAGLLALVLSGPSPLSLDRYLAAKRGASRRPSPSSPTG